MTTILEAQHLARWFQSKTGRLDILADVTFTVEKGEFISLVGPSGCGKTTLLMCLAGLQLSSGGEIRFQGKVVTEPPRGVSVVFQDYSRSLFPWKTAEQNVTFGMRRLQLSRTDQISKARELLREVGLSGFERHYPWQLSGGMQQRVAIARALGAESQLLLLDEPLAAVDAQTRADMQDLILYLARKFNQTCLLVTHDVDEAVYMADRVLVLDKRPTSIAKSLTVELPHARDQITTRELPAYLAARHDVLSFIRAKRNSGGLEQ